MILELMVPPSFKCRGQQTCKTSLAHIESITWNVLLMVKLANLIGRIPRELWELLLEYSEKKKLTFSSIVRGIYKSCWLSGAMPANLMPVLTQSSGQECLRILVGDE